MRFHRKDRMASVIQKELSELVQHEIEFRGALVTITHVEVVADLETARVLISVLPEEKSALVLKVLKKFQLRLQRMLLLKMNVRPMPRISFEIDRGAENAAAVEKSLLSDSINKE